MEQIAGALFQSGRYIVVVLDNHLDSNNRIKDAYAVVNITTGVSEFETFFLWEAMQWCIRCNTLVEKILTETGNTIEWLDESEDEDDEDEEEGPEDA